jgi:phosphohistidine phosphatase SixA
VFILVRHAHAGDKRQWRGEDSNRPLSERGRQQAEGLAHNLSALSTPRLISSPYVRCQQTLRPLAGRSYRTIETNRVLAPDARAADLDRFLRDQDLEGAVLCTHGETLAALIRRWQQKSNVTFSVDGPPADHPLLGKNATEKGAAWIVVDDETGRSAHYLRPLHVGPVLGPTSEQLVEGRGPEVKTRR